VCACAAAALVATAAHAGTIVKLNLGNSGPDVEMNSSGIFSTIDDGDASTVGDQNTSIEFTGELGFEPDLDTDTASFSLSNLTAVGPAQISGPFAVQNFTGGQFILYSSGNLPLLQGTLSTSALAGTAGVPGTGGLFSTNLFNITGGSLAGFIDPNSSSLALSLSNINDGNGLSIIPPTNGALQPFHADATATLASNIVPEPTSATLLILGCAALLHRRRRSHE
jgi:hypothetical protein